MKKKLVIAICLILAFMMVSGCGQVSSEPKEKPKEITDSESYTEEEDIQEESVEEEIIEDEPIEEEPEKTESMSEDEMEKAAREIVSSIDGYKWILWEDGIIYDLKDVGDSIDIALSDKEKARIAAESTLIDKSSEIEIEPDMIMGQRLIEEDLKNAGFKIFGEPVNTDVLDNYSGDEREGTYYMDNDIVNIHYVGETDTDIQTNEIYVNFFPNQVRIDECFFIGHWSYIHDISTFVISYEFTENADAEYGISLTGIHIERIGKETPNEYDESDFDYAVDESFYGIWIGASKNEDEANEILEKARDNGFENARVLLSTDWEKLNSDPYYVVTAGTYNSKEDANAELDSVKLAGFTGAYVKDTGEYIGE